MKMKTVLFLLVGLFSFATTQPAMAITSPSTSVSASVIAQQSKDLKKEFKMQKKMNQMERFFAKKGIDLSDPVKKWLWFWAFGAAGAILFWILAAVTAVSTVSTAATTGAVSTGFGIAGVFGLLALLCALFAGVSFVIWLIKKFG